MSVERRLNAEDKISSSSDEPVTHKIDSSFFDNATITIHSKDWKKPKNKRTDHSYLTAEEVREGIQEK